ncbi:MAG TPA: TetR/AcrR family transcriptional regulator [Candidatus Hydrogenedentes bacterium]|nr:TetR/AcrR family transcriptional regulator [Candidatus Hydrogenedentota bacterium]
MPPQTPGNYDSSRQIIVDTAFEILWQKGYNGTRVDEIIERTPFTKGAFYHHFPSKKALVSAVIDEIIGGMMHKRWATPLKQSTTPLATLIALLDGCRRDGEKGVRRGCPLNNLAQELSCTDDEIRAQVNNYFQEWIAAFEDAIARAQLLGQAKADVTPRVVAIRIVAAYEGAVSLAKAARDPEALNVVLDNLIAYLRGLQSPPHLVDLDATNQTNPTI